MDVGYYSNGLYTDDPEKAKRCVVHVNDRTLSATIEEAGKQGGIWSTASAIEINGREIASSDIPVNLAACDRPKVVNDFVKFPEIGGGISHLDAVEQLPKTCTIYSIHGHNVRDINAAFHVHIKCAESSMDTLDKIADIMGEANDIGWQMCGKIRPKKTKQEIPVMF